MLNSSNMAGFITKSISQFIGGNYYSKGPEPSPYILGTSPPDGSMELYILDNKLQVCSCPKENIKNLCHDIIKIALLPDSRPSFFSITETANQYTLILTEDAYKELPENSMLQSSGQPWRVLTVSIGALGSFNEIIGVSKIARSAIGPLADHDISVLCLSTYQADYILVQESQLDDTIRCLSSYFKIFNEDHKRVNETKAMSPASPLPKKSRPIVHPMTSPNKVFHVAGLDSSKLSGVVSILLELLFFPRTHNEETDDDFSFFHFTIVHGDISLVLDDHSFNKFPNNTLYTSQLTKDEKWRMIRIGNRPLGFVECGIVAQVVEPLATSQTSSYYLSTFDVEYCMVRESEYTKVNDLFEKLKIENFKEDDPVEGEDEVDEAIVEDLEKKLEEIRPGENMSLGETLESIQDVPNTVAYQLAQNAYSRSPLTPTSECSSYGTSPQSDTDAPAATPVTSSAETMTTDPIPIPANCLRDSLTRLKC